MPLSLKNVLLICLALLSLAVPALADVNIEDVLVRRKGQDMNIRVNLYNPGGVTQQGVRVTLYVRPDSGAQWEQVKVWNIGTIPSGNRIARDFFEAANPHLQDIAGNPAFEALAVVEAPGIQPLEMTGVYQPGEH